MSLIISNTSLPFVMVNTAVFLIVTTHAICSIIFEIQFQLRFKLNVKCCLHEVNSVWLRRWINQSLEFFNRPKISQDVVIKHFSPSFVSSMNAFWNSWTWREECQHLVLTLFWNLSCLDPPSSPQQARWPDIHETLRVHFHMCANVWHCWELQKHLQSPVWLTYDCASKWITASPS